MKKLFSLLFISFLLNSCDSKNYELEEQFLECFYQHHTENNIEVKPIIQQLKILLVKHKVLKGTTGKDIIDFVQQVKDDNDVQQPNSDFFKELEAIGYFPTGVKCSKPEFIKFDSTSYAQSKLKGVVEIFHVRNDFSLSIIANNILQRYTAQDFDHEFYNTVFVCALCHVMKSSSKMDRGLPVFLPPENTEDRQAKEDDFFSVLLNSEGQLLAQEEAIEISDLKPLVKSFLSEQASKTKVDLPLIGKQFVSNGIISITIDRGTTYTDYIKIRDALKSAIKELRVEQSLLHFQTHFDELTKAQRQVIKRLIPSSISESEP